MSAGGILNTVAVLTLAAVLCASAYGISAVYACFNPRDLSAVEALLNRPGIGYNLTALRSKHGEVVFAVEEGKAYAFKYVYLDAEGRSLAFGVTIYLEAFCGAAPCAEHFNEDEPTYSVVGLRMELLEPCTNQTTESSCPSRPALASAFAELLRAMAGEGVLTGLGEGDIRAIADAVARNDVTAGWNGRLMYSEQIGGWATYGELVYSGLAKGVVVRAPKCSYELPPEIAEGVRGSAPALVLKGGGEALRQTSNGGQLNGLAVAIAVALGVAVAISIYAALKILHRI